MVLYNNENNDTLKFKINSEGIDVNNIEPRLILTSNENKNYLFIGEIDGDICKFDLPKLENYKKDDNGKIRFEIIYEDMYFPVWEDKFDIVTKANIQFEGLVNDVEELKKEKKIKIGASPVITTEKDNRFDLTSKTIEKKENTEPIKENSNKIKEETKINKKGTKENSNKVKEETKINKKGTKEIKIDKSETSESNVKEHKLLPFDKFF
jgi:hypothetical protein